MCIYIFFFLDLHIPYVILLLLFCYTVVTFDSPFCLNLKYANIVNSYFINNDNHHHKIFSGIDLSGIIGQTPFGYFKQRKYNIM